MSSIRACPASAVRTMPKRNQVKVPGHLGISSNVLDPFTRSPAVLSPPAYLNSNLPRSSHAPRATMAPVPQGKTRTVSTLSDCEQALAPCVNLLSCRPPTLPTQAQIPCFAGLIMSTGRRCPTHP